jgi:hypothetical protein
LAAYRVRMKREVGKDQHAMPLTTMYAGAAHCRALPNVWAEVFYSDEQPNVVASMGELPLFTRDTMLDREVAPWFPFMRDTTSWASLREDIAKGATSYTTTEAGAAVKAPEDKEDTPPLSDEDAPRVEAVKRFTASFTALRWENRPVILNFTDKPIIAGQVYGEVMRSLMQACEHQDLKTLSSEDDPYRLRAPAVQETREAWSVAGFKDQVGLPPVLPADPTMPWRTTEELTRAAETIGQPLSNYYTALVTYYIDHLCSWPRVRRSQILEYACHVEQTITSSTILNLAPDEALLIGPQHVFVHDRIAPTGALVVMRQDMPDGVHIQPVPGQSEDDGFVVYLVKSARFATPWFEQYARGWELKPKAPMLMFMPPLTQDPLRW